MLSGAKTDLALGQERIEAHGSLEKDPDYKRQKKWEGDMLRRKSYMQKNGEEHNRTIQNWPEAYRS